MKNAPGCFINLPMAVCLLVAIWGWTIPDAFAVEFDDIVITPELTPSGNSYHGYAEYRFAVTNRSPDKTHKVKLIFPKESLSYSGNRIREMTRTVLVGPSATVYVSLFQLPVEMYGHSLGVVIDDRAQDERVPLSTSRHGGRHYTITPPPPTTSRSSSSWSPGTTTVFSAPVILMSRNVDAKNLHAHANKLLTATSSLGRGSYETIDLGLPVSAWSTNWLGFSRYDGVVVTGDDIRQMPPAVQSALWRYVECGGALLVLGGLELPESWELRESEKSEPLTDAAGFANYNIGFGQCIVSTEADTKSLNSEQWREVVESWLQTAIPWQIGWSIEDANRMFPVVSEGLGIPVRGLFLLMLLFVAVIGPVNLIVLSRKKRRIWMVWTVPLISLFTCAAVFAYATLAEGWNQRGRTEGVTILDERIHRATTIGWTAFYTALTPGDGLHFSYETELTPQAIDMMKIDRTINWTKDQHLQNGWVTARIPAYFMLRKSEVRRERVTVRTEANGHLKIVNGLGADIRKFWLADRNGTIHTGANIRAGAETELTPQQELPLSEVDRGSEPDEMVLFDGTLVVSLSGKTLVELWDAALPSQLNKGTIPSLLKDEMQHVGASLSHDAVVSVQKHGQQWQITDRFSGLTYTIEKNQKKMTDASSAAIHTYQTSATGLRRIFSSNDWITNMEELIINPEEYLRPGCYIASLDAAPFIEEGLKKVKKKQYSSIVYGILAEE